MKENNIMNSENSWKYCQNHSNEILAEGMELLKKSIKLNGSSDFPNCPGNYLISFDKKPYYIGEARSINKRMKQQFNMKQSTFYKNYLRNNLANNEKVDIDAFDVQIINSFIGTKEMEEFGIVNLPTKLNKFQLGKRDIFHGKAIIGTWGWIQNNTGYIFEQADDAFQKKVSDSWYDAEVLRGPGIYYVVSKDYGLIYIGESSNIFDRYKTHSQDTRFSALRRHIAKEILGFKLKSKKELGLKTKESGKKKMSLSKEEDQEVNEFLEGCQLKTEIVTFGRYEFEDYLIKKYKPILNIKGNI